MKWVFCLPCAIGFKVFGAMGCPLREFDPNCVLPDQRHDFAIPVRSVERFELEFLVVDAICVSSFKTNQNFSNGLQDIQMVNIKSNDRNTRFDRYLRVLIDSVILPRAKLAIKTVGYEVLDHMASIGVFGTLLPTDTKIKPALEEDSDYGTIGQRSV